MYYFFLCLHPCVSCFSQTLAPLRSSPLRTQHPFHRQPLMDHVPEANPMDTLNLSRCHVEQVT